MVDPELIDVSKLDVETRRRIVLYVIDEKKVSPSTLGYSASYIHKVRKGQAAPSDELVKKCVRYLTAEELARLLDSSKVPEVTIIDVLRIIERALRDPALRETFLNLLEKYFGEYLFRKRQDYVVAQRDVELFVKKLRQEGRSEKTVREHLRYLVRFLARTNFVISPDLICETLLELREENRMLHVTLQRR